MYKDPDKQREADKARQQRRRDVIKAKGVTNTGRDGQGVTSKPGDVFEKTVYAGPKAKPAVLKRKTLAEITNEQEAIEKGCCSEGVTGGDDALPKRGKDIKTFADLSPSVQQTINTLSDDKAEHKRRTAIAINYQHLFPDRYHSTSAVSTGTVTGKPGDADYDGICTPEWRAERGR